MRPEAEGLHRFRAELEQGQAGLKVEWFGAQLQPGYPKTA